MHSSSSRKRAFDGGDEKEEQKAGDKGAIKRPKIVADESKSSKEEEKDEEVEEEEEPARVVIRRPISRTTDCDKALMLLALGLLPPMSKRHRSLRSFATRDDNPLQRSFRDHPLFDKNVLGIIKKFLVTSTAFGSYGDSYGQFHNPVGTVLNPPTNELFVVDIWRHCVQKFSADGRTFISKFGSEGYGNGALCNPRAIALDSISSRLFVVDDTRLVQSFTLDGDFVSEIGKGELSYPCGVAILHNDSGSLLFVSDANLHCIVVFEATSGAYRFQLGFSDNADEQLYWPLHMCIDAAAKEVYVLEWLNHRVSVFSTSSGALLRRISSYGENYGLLLYPSGIALHPTRDEILVADTHNHRLQVFNSKSGVYLRSFSSRGKDVGNLILPCGMCVHPATGDVYVCDARHRVQIFHGLFA